MVLSLSGVHKNARSFFFGFSTLRPSEAMGKQQSLNRRRWRTRMELSTALFEYLEIFHNRQRSSDVRPVMVETLEQALRDRSAKGEAAGVRGGTALNYDDAGFVEHWCVQVGTRAVSGIPLLLGLAGPCLGPCLSTLWASRR
jgi:hypothetical protein